MTPVIGRNGRRGVVTRAAVWTLLVTALWSAVTAPPAAAAPLKPPAEAQAIITVAEVKVGMLGYGRTVFHGDTIESFPVKVVSVVPDSDPQHAVVWVDCYGERMQEIGPVQGMSGSPIYLWDEGEEGTIGQGGRLLGAFAFGYALTNQCMVGVQPIEYMRQVGGRAGEMVEGGRFARDANAGAGAEANGSGDADAAGAQRAGTAGHGTHASRLGIRPGLGAAMIAGLDDLARQRGSSASDRLRLDAAKFILEATPWGRRNAAVKPASNPAAPDASAAPPTNAFPGTFPDAPAPLMLPMSVGSAETATIMTPLLAPLGIAPQAGGTMSGPAPSNVTPENVTLEPGSVLAIPLAFGDATPAAVGTVTDVLPDGTVLGFGHAMDGAGDTALPLATGYVHFIVSRITNSFKLSGVIAMQGSITQDEATAVAGNNSVAYTTSPITTRVKMPEQPERTYHFEAVNHPGYTPSIAVMLPITAFAAVQQPPELNTMHLTGSVVFSDGRTLDLDALLPFGSQAGLAYEIAPIMGAALANEFEPIELASMDVSLVVEPGVKLAFLQGASVSPAVAEPGQTVTVTVQLQPYGEPATTQRFDFDLPTDVPDGDYHLAIGDAASHQNQLFMTQPKWQVIDTLDELFEAFEMSLSIRRDALYASLTLDASPALSVGNSALPSLPSSRFALLAKPGNSAVQPAITTLDRVYPSDRVITGEVGVALTIRHEK